MRSPANSSHVTLLADLESATALALRRGADGWALVDTLQFTYEPAALFNDSRIPQLRSWIDERQLRGATNSIHFVGQGTIVQVLRMPPTRPRDRQAAVRTRLTSFASGRSLYVAQRLLPAPRDKEIELVAAGVDAVACRALCAACEDAGLRVRYAGALPADVGPQTRARRLLQMIVTQRTTTLQVFDEGRLVLCRDVLLGRRDLVAALRRPILTEAGPVTLEESQARRLLHEVGIPWERDEEVFESGIRGAQLWPLLTPVLQRFQNELEQTLAHRRLQPPSPTVLLTLSVPQIPALDVALASDLELDLPDDPPHDLGWLVFNARSHRRDRALDLRPLPRRVVDRLARPAAAAALLALGLFALQSHQPRSASAQVESLLASAQRLEQQRQSALALAQALEQQLRRGLDRLERRRRLATKLPPAIHARAVAKFLFSTLPGGARLQRLHVEVDGKSVTAELQARYLGREPAGLIANRWARALAGHSGVLGADIARVRGSGQNQPATIVLHVRLSLEPGP